MGIKQPKSNHREPIPDDIPIEDQGYFKPESLIRQIHREAVVLLGGGRAILLQLAHPFVAAGVDDYSNFKSNILQRLYRTILFMHNLVFQDRQTAREALKHFHAMHKRIRGRLGHRSGQLSPDTTYSGVDPRAKLWVYATFVDTNLTTYQKFVKPLSQVERQQYYSDSLVLADLMEIPEEILPQTYTEFQEYMKTMFTGETLAVTNTAQNLANAVLYPDVGLFPTLSAGLLRTVTAGLLPQRFRCEYGLTWNSNQKLFVQGFSSSTRLLRPFVPSWIWQSPLLGGKLTYLLLWGTEKPGG
ncbi:DUF2236 domain-containing protein [Aliifodinibius sp. S!AR15-10]|uniref:oxygenase MpaB family protein n=1 Tax=Aliifodinibius sp. S!AR15-10 TaxID=2950437 RepID=UPI00286769A3|nr:oxygenase MpaB family protein [Aliifodinibius sp. S!AR15-10]MDR8394303.1 DUF2236 domain-containing protein [Aliifodinibius sp. S!AR15-10]